MTAPSATAPPAAASPATDAAPPVGLAAAETLLDFELAVRHVTVRLLQEQDVRLLEWHGGAELRSFYEAEWVAHCHGTMVVVVADFSGYPIGQGAIVWAGNDHHPNVPHIQSLRVFPAFRGLGVGSRMMEAGERLVARHGHRQVSLSVGVANDGARRLYLRQGYRITSEPYVDVWHYTDSRQQSVRVEELVVDMLKDLGSAADAARY